MEKSEEDFELSEVELLNSSKNNFDIVETSPKGRFSRFKELVGTGAYKAVYKAVDNDTGCEVAWNTVKTGGLTKADKERVLGEINMIQKLHHPNIIHFIKAWYSREKEEVNFITEIMTGGSLKQYLKKIRRPHLRVLKQWCVGILKGLYYLHSQKPYPIIHRDLKCDNIFVCSNTGDVRIGDLGLSTFMTASHNKSVIGTPQYMAPELFEERYGPSVDVYAFGMCLLEMCTGKTPYSECKTPGDIYRRVASGIKPYDIERVKDEEVKSFILLCLGPCDMRPTVQELLEDSFFSIDDRDERMHKSVSLEHEDSSPDSSKTEPPPLNSQVHDLLTFEEEKTHLSEITKICLVLGIPDPSTGQTKRKKLEFDYDLQNDSPDILAGELVENLGLPAEKFRPISQIIKQRVSEYRNKQSTAPFDSSLSPIGLNGGLHRSGFQDLKVFIPKGLMFRGKENDPSAVRFLKIKLAQALGVNLEINGVFDNYTESLVKAYQEAQGMKPNGIINEEVWTSLLHNGQNYSSYYECPKSAY